MDVGVIGVGAMGKNHLRIYSELRGIDDIYAYDVDKTALINMCAKYGANACYDIESLLKRIDAVSICVPTKYHFLIAKQVLEHGVNFLLEKPVTLDLEEGIELKKMAKSRDNIVVGVGHIERFNPIVKEIKTLLCKPRLIEIKRHNPSSSRVSDADVVSDLMIHDIDIVWNCLFDQMQYELHSIGDPDVMKVVAKFGDCIVSLSASRIACKKIRSIIVECEEFTIEGDFMTQEVYLYKRPGKYLQDSTKYMQENIIEKVTVNKVEPLREELKTFIDCVRKGKSFPVTLDQGLFNLYLAKKITCKKSPSLLIEELVSSEP